MNLGSSMRRHRHSGRAGASRPSLASLVESLREASARNILLGVAALLVGTGGGYLYATQVMYPAAEVVDADFLETPDLRGLDLVEAETFLQEAGFEVGRVDSISHPEVPLGEILGQTPLPGQLGLLSGSVDLTVSLGPERREIPDVTRLRADRALTVLETTGFTVQIDSVQADIAEGRVVETNPDPGTMLTLPSEVRLTVSLGPPMIEMPRLMGLQEEEAIVVLDSLGLSLGEVETRFRFGFNQGEVLEHYPVADSLVAAGTEVRLVIGRRGFFE